MLNGTAPKIPARIACHAVFAAASGLPSPIRRATSAVVPMESPSTIAKTRMINEPVRPTVATAADPSLPTKYMSTNPNVDSMTSSSIMGIASRRIARISGILV